MPDMEIYFGSTENGYLILDRIDGEFVLTVKDGNGRVEASTVIHPEHIRQMAINLENLTG